MEKVNWLRKKKSFLRPRCKTVVKNGSYVLRNTFISGAGKYRTLCFKQGSRTPENKIRSSRTSRCCFQLEAALFSIGPTHVT